MTKFRTAAFTALLTTAAVSIALLLTARLTDSEITHDEKRLLLVSAAANLLAIWLMVVAGAVGLHAARKK